MGQYYPSADDRAAIYGDGHTGWRPSFGAQYGNYCHIVAAIVIKYQCQRFSSDRRIGYISPPDGSGQAAAARIVRSRGQYKFGNDGKGGVKLGAGSLSDA